MKLKNLQISNFRCFDSLSIDLDEQLTVLVAENGVGKTAILDAIAVALGPFIGGFDTGVSKGFKSEDARLAIREALHITRPEDVILQMESQYAVSLIALGIIEGQSEQWSRELTGKKTQTTFGKARVIINYAKNNYSYAELTERLAPEFLLLLDVTAKEIQLPFTVPHYQIQQYNHCKFLLTPSLGNMLGDTQEAKLEKSKLWLSLKKMFNI